MRTLRDNVEGVMEAIVGMLRVPHMETGGMCEYSRQRHRVEGAEVLEGSFGKGCQRRCRREID